MANLKDHIDISMWSQITTSANAPFPPNLERGLLTRIQCAKTIFRQVYPQVFIVVKKFDLECPGNHSETEQHLRLDPMPCGALVNTPTKWNPSTSVSTEGERGFPLIRTVVYFVSSGRGFGALSKEPLAPKFVNGVLALGPQVPVAFIHVCHSAVDDEQLVLRYLIVKHLGLSVLCHARDIDCYVLPQSLGVHRPQQRL